jgi:hypothetical protein
LLLVTTERSGHRIKISNIRTGALVCKFGGHDDDFAWFLFGRDEDEFSSPKGVAVMSFATS